MNNHNLIIFFDGICGLCNHFVDFILRIDQKHVFSFAPLQGKAAQNFLLSKNQEMNSIVLYAQGQWYEKSEACLHIFNALGGGWKLLVIFKLLPRFLRDFIYDFIARHRYEWFGKRESCRLPTSEEKEFFLN